jgi:hypothetical protein
LFFGACGGLCFASAPAAGILFIRRLRPPTSPQSRPPNSSSISFLLCMYCFYFAPPPPPPPAVVASPFSKTVWGPRAGIIILLCYYI